MESILRSPRVWLYAAGGWLLLTGLAHTTGHVWTFVLENGIFGQREFAMNAMKQAFSQDPLQPSLWRLLRSLSVSFSLFLTFGGVIPVMLAWMTAPPRILRAYALFGTLLWTVAFVLYVFVEPVVQPIVIAGIAATLHAIAWVTANEDARIAATASASVDTRPA